MPPAPAPAAGADVAVAGVAWDREPDAVNPGRRSPNRPPGLFGQLGQRRHPAGQVVDDLHELPEIGRQVAQHRVVSVLARRSSPGMTASTGADSRDESSSASFTVRVTCGTIARTGSSMSFSRRLTRCAVSLRFAIVVLKFSKLFISSSAPRRS